MIFSSISLPYGREIDGTVGLLILALNLPDNHFHQHDRFIFFLFINQPKLIHYTIIFNNLFPYETP